MIHNDTMIKPEPGMFLLQDLVAKFTLVERNHNTANTKSRENDVEHSYSVAMLCWFIHDRYQVPLNIGKILKYALVHDFVEVYAGDVNTFACPADRQKKVKDEKVALEKLAKELSDFSDMVTRMRNYENKIDDEALFVWTVDKMQALVMADLDDWRPFKKTGKSPIDYQTFTKTEEAFLQICSPFCRDIFTSIVEYCKITHYDGSKK